MYSERYEPYIEEMTEDISDVAKSLALEAERDVPETGLFPKITVEFKDKSAVKFKQDKQGVLLLFDQVPDEVDYVIELTL